MQKPRIVIASTLKPLLDPRSFYRFALSLRETNKYRLNIIGFSTKKAVDQSDIHFHSLFESKRTAFKRLFVGIKFLRLLKMIRPKLIIVTTYELLLPAVIYKVFNRCKLIYDVQENHRFNVRYNSVNSKPFQFLILPLIQLIEFGSRPFIDQYILAEVCYKEEMPWVGNAVILENKYFGEYKEVVPKRFEANQPLNFLIAGTLTEVYGILEGIYWFGEFVKQFPSARLHVIGHVTMEEYAQKILEAAVSISQILLDISFTPIPYERILDAYEVADLVLMPYYQIPSISPKVPSKMYECLAMGIPFLHAPNEKWASITNQYQAGFEVDFSDMTNIPRVIDHIFNATFFEQGIVKSAYWKAKEQEILKQLIGDNLK